MKDPKDMTEEELVAAELDCDKRASDAIDSEFVARAKLRMAYYELGKVQAERDRRRSTPPGGAK